MLYTQKACEKAKRWEVAELSGNFHGELSPPDGGEGALPVLNCEKNKDTHGTVCNAQGKCAAEG